MSNIFANTRLAYAATCTAVGFAIGLVQEGEPGYVPMPFGVFDTFESAQARADELNLLRGLTPEEAARIVASSMKAQNQQEPKGGAGWSF